MRSWGEGVARDPPGRAVRGSRAVGPGSEGALVVGTAPCGALGAAGVCSVPGCVRSQSLQVSGLSLWPGERRRGALDEGLLGVRAVVSGLGDRLGEWGVWVALGEARQEVPGCVLYGVGQARDVECGTRKVLPLYAVWGAHVLGGALE